MWLPSFLAGFVTSAGDIPSISPYEDGHLLDSSVKTSQFLWMKTRHSEKHIEVPGQNSSQEFTLLLNLEGSAIPPFSGNITTTNEQFANIQLNEKSLTSLTLLQESPWRKVLMYMEIRQSEYLNCDLDFRLHSNTTYNLVIQGYFYEFETLLFVYVNGKLHRKCRHEGPSFNKIQDSANKTQSNRMTYTLENKPDTIIVHHRVVYWPRALSYHEVQQISLSSASVVDSARNSLLVDSPTSTSTWYKDALQRYPSSNSLSAMQAQASTSACIDESVAVILFPGFYSGKVNSKLFSVAWVQKHILESLQHTLHSITLCYNGQVMIYIPLSFQHREYVEQYVLDKVRLPSSSDISFEFYTIPETVKPLSHKLDNLTVSYAFATVANAVLEEITLSPKSEQVDYIGVLFSYIYPEKNWLVGLIEGGLSAGSADIVGGKIVHMSGVLMHYGYELLELSFNGGLDVMLTPHHMYRWVLGVDCCVILAALCTCVYPTTERVESPWMLMCSNL